MTKCKSILWNFYLADGEGDSTGKKKKKKKKKKGREWLFKFPRLSLISFFDNQNEMFGVFVMKNIKGFEYNLSYSLILFQPKFKQILRLSPSVSFTPTEFMPRARNVNIHRRKMGTDSICLLTRSKTTSKHYSGCVLFHTDVLLHRGWPTRRRNFWIRLMRRCGMTSDRLPRLTGRSGNTSRAGSNRALPWPRSGEGHNSWATVVIES